LQLFQQVCAAVHYAHRNLVLHRDIKPGNILVTADGSPRLLDFGIAKVLNPDLVDLIEPTVTALRLMTPEYASPEQVGGEPVTAASDIYSRVDAQLGENMVKSLFPEKRRNHVFREEFALQSAFNQSVYGNSIGSFLGFGQQSREETAVVGAKKAGA
jgi:serine/threonine protein kinase